MTTQTADKAKTNGNAEGARIEIPKPAIASLQIEVEGISPLICHRWSDKAKKMMLDKQMKKAGTGREAKDPERDFRESLYVLDPDQEEAWYQNGTEPDGFGFPAVAFKAAAIRAGKQVGLVMADLRTWFHVNGELVPIVGSPTPREDMVRVQQTSDIRYRGEFQNWSAVVPVELDESKLSIEQLVSLFEGAGFGVGVGEHRPERNGQNGRFRVSGVSS